MAGPLARRVASSHSVLRHVALLDRVSHCENELSLLDLVLVVLAGALDLLALGVERLDLLDQLRLRVVRSYVQIHVDLCRLHS